MSSFRFRVGASVMCNLGSSGWKLGTIIALRYREDRWPAGEYAPYQVALEDDHALIYVPQDDARYCREATVEDLRIAHRLDALAPGPEGTRSEPGRSHLGAKPSTQLGCASDIAPTGSPGYRKGRCDCCDSCPRSWSCAELYSEHYRCAARNGLRVTRRQIDLGVVRVGDSVHYAGAEDLPSRDGFMQCPTLVRLPPGVRFSDEGALVGEVRFDPHRDAKYKVEFVAVSTGDWGDPGVGLVRLEITFVVEGNELPGGFDMGTFTKKQEEARTAADGQLRNLVDAWQRWEQGELDNRNTCKQMLSEMNSLRELLEQHPRLDGGRWWALLGGFHMNVHKLLENTLFECELYLGHALTFGDADVRRMAEQNLEGCYNKRLLEAARFMWIDGLKQMMRSKWADAANTLSLAAAQKDGWGWAVNYGDIWLSEAAARLVHGAELAARGRTERSGRAEHRDGEPWIAEVTRLVEKGMARAEESGAFGSEGHPWATELEAAVVAYRRLRNSGGDPGEWLEAFKARTIYWCAQVLGGAPPFPPKPKPRLEEAAALARRLPGHNR